MQDIMSVILAAGEGKRMNSKNSKVVQKIFGKEMIKRVVERSEIAGIKENIVVVGHQKEQVMEVLGDKVKYAVQDQMLGTGHAVMQAESYFANKSGKIVILYGDAPLTRVETIKDLIQKNIDNDEKATVVTTICDNPKGYGRIARNSDGFVKCIIEEKDATEEQRKIKEVNCGIYCFDIQELVSALHELKPNNIQSEYYLTDVIGIIASKGLKAGTYVVEDKTEMIQPNDQKQLAAASNVLKLRILEKHMNNGVCIMDPDNTYIYDDVEIGRDTNIYPGTIIKSGVKIGEDCEIGPYAYIREGTELSNNVKIGAFVEVKKVKVAEKTKIPHLSYIGDAEIGSKCNIGCGTITCNYDGLNKSKTVIGNNTFIGSNTNLIAPVTLGDNVFVAAGSTITEDVPTDALAIARERQTNKDGWNKK